MEHISKAVDLALNSQEQSPENSQGLENGVPIAELDWRAEQALARKKKCIELCGLTERERGLHLANFATDKGNVAAVAVAKTLLNPGANLFLYGLVGRGKTHIAAGVVNQYAEQGVYSTFWTATRFLMRLRTMSLKTSDEDAMAELLQPKVLVLDDLGVTKITEWSLMMTDAVIDEWYRKGRTGLVITSNFDLDAIAQRISDRVASRIAQMCKVFELGGKDWRVPNV